MSLGPIAELHFAPACGPLHTGHARPPRPTAARRPGRTEEAEPLLLEGYDTIRARRGDNSVATRRAARALARFYREQGEPQRAAAYERSGS